MLTGEPDQTIPNNANGRSEMPDMLAGFIDELMHACNEYNGTSGREIKLDMQALSDDSGMVSYRNVYLQYRIRDQGRLVLVLSIGWYGSGFHLMAAPDLQFGLVGNQWREQSNPMLAFDSSPQLAAFLISELEHHGQSPASRYPSLQQRTQFAM